MWEASRKRKFRQSGQTWDFLAKKIMWQEAMAILAASLNIAVSTTRESQQSIDRCQPPSTYLWEVFC